MPRTTWKSLNSRILLLAAVTCLFLGISAVSFFSFLRHSQSASLSASERHLISVATALAHSYEDHVSASDLLSAEDDSTPDGILLAPPPLPDGTQPDAPPRPPAPPRAHAVGPLTRLTASVLSHEEGIEGGFYLAATQSLTGYAFPTHEGPGPRKELPQRERPTILRLAQQATASRTAQSFRFEGPHDAVLIVAAPVRDLFKRTGTGDTVPNQMLGAVWLMERVPGLNGEQNRQLLLTSLGFGTAALITAVIAFFVMKEIRGGVHVVLERLQSLESGFQASSSPASPEPLKEFGDVLQGVDRLALSLHQKIEKEKALEAELRHRERLSSLGQFAAGVAHELRNPLATIRMRTQMSQRSSGVGDVLRNSSVVLEEVDRLNAMIERLLYFARPITLAVEPVPFTVLCNSVVAGWQQRAAPVHVTCQMEGELTIDCDRGRLVQVLDNLIENAVASASGRGEEGKLEVRAKRVGPSVRISVHDNGSGFSEAALKHALDPFFTTRDSGTGLGLSIASELVQAHGGHLEYENLTEGGAAVSVVLPSGIAANGNLLLEAVHG